MKKIVFTIKNSEDEILYASFDELERNKKYKEATFGFGNACGEQIVDVDLRRENALAKLNEIDKLVLGFLVKPTFTTRNIYDQANEASYH